MFDEENLISLAIFLSFCPFTHNYEPANYKKKSFKFSHYFFAKCSHYFFRKILCEKIRECSRTFFFRWKCEIFAKRFFLLAANSDPLLTFSIYLTLHAIFLSPPPSRHYLPTPYFLFDHPCLILLHFVNLTLSLYFSIFLFLQYLVKYHSFDCKVSLAPYSFKRHGPGSTKYSINKFGKFVPSL